MASHVRYNKSMRAGNRGDVPIPTTRNPAPGTTIRRAKTLTRPERSIAPVPLLNPRVGIPIDTLPSARTVEPKTDWWDPWVLFSYLVTFWAPSFLLETIGGLKQASMRQAWREKVALCVVALLLGAFVGFATMGLQAVFCPSSSTKDSERFQEIGSVPGMLGIQGYLFNITESKPEGGVDFYTIPAGTDITPNFTRTAAQFTSCQGLNFRVAQDAPCPTQTSCPLPTMDAATYSTLQISNTSNIAGYDWSDVSDLTNYLVIDGAVLNMEPYMELHKTPVPGDDVDLAIRTLLQYESQGGGKDGTRLFYSRTDLASAVPCMKERYYAGNIDKITPGCFVSQLILYAGLIVILGLVLVRFVMACIFSWFLSSRLAGPPGAYELSRSAISPAVMPEGANVAIDNRNGIAPWAGPAGGKRLAKPTGGKYARSTNTNSSVTLTNDSASPIMNLAQIGPELFCVCLVTCYSEGEESLRSTLDSISQTTYSDTRKLLFVVADGMITGAGEKRSTPDICVSLLDADPRFGNPMPMSYLAVGSGAKAENRAMVYAGHYTVAGRRTPMIIVVKCGTENEAMSDKKPGNRGKRDSQLILMNFFSRVTYNDRMSPLDFDMFRKIHVLMGITPDFFEVCLMVDADTKVYPDSIKYLVNCMHHDPMVMGVCGETRISNKRQSWVTAIQVYEYFIAHHMAKAFESVFGGVTCLPGCFSMYRLKGRKQSLDDWVPLIIKPEVIQEYSQSEVHTLHQKNLLLLGEDRFLTTLLLRTFPNRKMMFLPQAKCRTVAPDTFKVLLSQRRRWINSTIHNLMELVLVRDLCGTFCFSMQFIVFMDLLGTTVLPVALCLTYTLVVNMALSPPKTFEEAIPLMLLLAVIGLPAVLILITTRKVVYVFWMLLYLVALPVWNFVLPVYSFWHFDDFSWGETRKVEGELKDLGHGAGSGKFHAINVPLRRWEDWERSRLRKIKREERRRKDLERMNQGYYGNGNELHTPGGPPNHLFEADAASLASSDDDQWGGQVGGYNENAAHYPPPPVALTAAQQDTLTASKTLEAGELEAMLEGGFDDDLSDEMSQRQSQRQSSIMRYQLSESVPQPARGYAQLTRGAPPLPDQVGSPMSPYVPVNASSTAVGGDDWRTHAKKRSGSRGYRASDEPQDYGPLGPLGQRRF